MTTGAAETPVRPALTAKQGGQNPLSAAIEAASVTVVRDNAHEEPMDLMSAVLERPNMQRAYARVWSFLVCSIKFWMSTRYKLTQ